ncbi:uncharacterized protein K452DRAFT_298492 [Aplosporella prunicola CBS 121167]|uniref:DNA polymerase alpha/delta/epsilon subunit B domain-containing protein n=1 Tax=Aplosporella prunicola CBS 121167 TaxID=1176127 RepID=A0A6A6BH05_9PEZI|nr:uncharacterized protein K452DRAFT_298492 [Aplosporella prunicola CBS 121167]KAF2141831.1 hypothetical protein K452DRAFT_298492 [Aplosporella prunicola CBS 121167]
MPLRANFAMTDTDMGEGAAVLMGALDNDAASAYAAAAPATRSNPPAYVPRDTFALPKGADRHYAQQYADMYYARLSELKPVLEERAMEAWAEFEISGQKARQVERVLDVRQGELSWVVGTVYCEMALKPNILDDIAKEHWMAAPPRREKYRSSDGKDEMMLEDESGRLRLTGAALDTDMLVTGCIIAALGSENADGVFEVIATQVPDLPAQPARWALTGKQGQEQRAGNKIALVSGLGISGAAGNTMALDLLAEYLTGEAQSGAAQASAQRISRLIIAGDSLAHASPIPSREDVAAKKGQKHKYGYDAAAYNAAPTERLDDFLAALLPTLPVTLLPGAQDPASVAVPQQPLHAALFPKSRAWAAPPGEAAPDTPRDGFPMHAVTNPWEGEVDGWRFLGSGGQPVADVAKYVAEESRAAIMERMLRWRNNAPTAPDTLWTYPFQDSDPLLLLDCPHVYFAGNQPHFETSLIEGPEAQAVRLVALPRFVDTGEIVLLDAETLDVEVVRVGVGLGGRE